ncbi:MAG TPA: histidine triad nucleotide-binding protein [Candidatus Eisenbacteria bacterium]
MEECLFCRIAAGTIPARTVFEDDDVVAFEDIQPQAPVHLLLIPRRHVANLNDLGSDDHHLVGRLLEVAKRLAGERGLAETGYRVVTNTGADAGQTVLHLHLHLLGGRPLGWPPG